MDKELQDTLALVNSIYDAALDHKLWPSILESICALINARSACLLIHEPNSMKVEFMTATALDEQLLQDYEDYYYQLEPWHKPLLEGAGKILTTQEMYPESVLAKSEYYNDWGKAIGIFHGIGGFIDANDDRIVKIGFHRPKGLSRFGKEEKASLLLLAQHINRSLDINQKTTGIQSSYQSILELIEKLDTGVILIDENKRPVFLNKKAEDLFNQKHGLRIKNNKITTHSHKETQALDKLIHESVLTGLGKGLSGGGDLLLKLEGHTKSLQIQILPLSTHRNNLDLNAHKVCAVILVKSADNTVNQNDSFLQLRYGLTPAEIKLVTELANGLSLNQIAEKYQLSKHTVRSQIKSCFSKTGTHRQLELVKLVLSHSE